MIRITYQKRNIRLCLLFCMAAVLLTGCFKADEPPVFSLGGRITDSGTQEALSGVTVTLSGGANPLSKTTDGSGEYLFEGLPGDISAWTIKAAATDYDSFSENVTIASKSGKNTKDIQLKFVPSMNASATSLSFASSGGSNTFNITSNTGWTVSSSATSWLTVSPASGNKAGTVTATATANTATSSRTGTITVAGGGLTQTVSVSQAASSSSTAKVTVSSALTIDNGVMLYLSFSSNTKDYQEACYAKSNLPSDAAITNALLDKTSWDTSYSKTPFSSLSPNTTYVYCAIASDNSNARGSLTKYEFTTKATSGYAMTTVTVPSVSASKVFFTASMNSYCRSYSMACFTSQSSKGYDSDIMLAATLYENRTNSSYLESSNYTSSQGYYYELTSNSSTYDIGVVCALGFSSTNGGGTSGLLSRVWFSRTSGSVITRSAPVLRSDGTDESLKKKANAMGSTSDVPPMLKRINNQY